MKYAVTYEWRSAGQCLVVPCDATPGGARKQVRRMRAWADAHGVPVVGGPFVTLHSAFSVSVHLPIETVSRPDVGAELAIEHRESIPVAHAGPVFYGDARALSREVVWDLLGTCEPRGEIEFHLHPLGLSFESGWVVVPLSSYPTNEPSIVAIPEGTGAVGRHLVHSHSD